MFILQPIISTNSSECAGASGEALEVHTVDKNLCVLLQISWNVYPVLQFTRSTSDTATHYGRKCMINQATCLLLLALLLMVHACNNTDCNKLMIFSIACPSEVTLFKAAIWYVIAGWLQLLIGVKRLMTEICGCFFWLLQPRTSCNMHSSLQ